ncbi:origin recognition complex subunit 4 C-terminus-domain-containing protein [Massariosphaeria phaeospora]|uniref:Origin recognition complex subunit 4 n=1 Tax=Massariosphaeria phaeospora TaxID=100035 RepID=A0A7C8ILQ5_9PLEO|nr:origin recognition complex subunit 4 C-terminus-domain-containing protein [Massariosphaeria phaeospora]
MDDSPRSSKRRKLDTPKRAVSGALLKTSVTRASGRLANRSVSYTPGKAGNEEPKDEEASPVRKARTSKKPTPSRASVKPTPRKKTVQEEKDVYDDIEGAFSASPTPTRRFRSKLGSLANRREEDAASTGGTSDELQKPKRTPTARKGSNGVNGVSGDSASRSSFRTLVNGYKHTDGADNDAPDELADEVTTPTSRAKDKKATRSSARKIVQPQAASAPRTGTRRPRRRTGDAGDGADEGTDNVITVNNPVPRSTRKIHTTQYEKGEDEPAAPTPSRTSRRRIRLEERSTVPDSEDDLATRNPPSVVKSGNARRRANRADHVGNEDQEIVLQSEDEDRVNGASVLGLEDEDEDGMDVDGNSALGSVLDPTEPSPFNKPTSAQKQSQEASTPLITSTVETGKESDLLKSIVMERIMGKRSAPLVGLDEEYKTVYQLVEHTITAGEGNSMLVIGARGSGKTALVNKVLSEISKDNREDYLVVRLNGFIHTDDKIALREIWRQLGKEMDIEEDGGQGKNYADTLTTLLALLSHPSEQTGELTDQVATAVIFVMDEFDLFAQHPRQTLLYNLFDIAQSRKAPIAVLGLTTRIDVANSLEKRVKSRFSHRYVHLSLAKTFTAFQELCKASLLIQPDYLSVEERSILASTPKPTPGRKSKKAAKQDVLAEWNANIHTLFASKAFLTTHLAPTFHRTKSLPEALSTFLLPTALLTPSTPLSPTPRLQPPDSKLALLPHLSTLTLSLLIAAARLDIIHDSDTCNFNMAYDEYVTLASRARIQSAAGGATSSGAVSKVWGKEVARREWEGLAELGFVMPVVAGLAGGFGMVRVDVALEEVGAVLAGEKGVDKGLERWCRQL